MNTTDFTKDAFKDLQILVIGDAMIDRYFYGKVNRQSPEANVPILDVDQIEHRLGGAGNVALNIAKMGAKAHLMTFKGNDDQADTFEELLRQEGICFKLLDSNRRTTVKTRLYNGNNYQMRFDYEDTHPMEDKTLSTLLKNVETACQKVPLDAIVLQDYNKGVLTEKSIPALLDVIAKYKIPVAVDPKLENFLAYKNVALFKPNLKELNTALNLDLKGDDNVGLELACYDLVDILNCDRLLLTRAEHGAIGFSDNTLEWIEAHPRNVVDVSGAGDTVIAMASLLLGLGLPMSKILYYSNLAGGLVIEERGVKALSLAEWEASLNL